MIQVESEGAAIGLSLMTNALLSPPICFGVACNGALGVTAVAVVELAKRVVGGPPGFFSPSINP